MSNEKSVISSIAIIQEFQDLLSAEARELQRAERVWLFASPSWLYLTSYCSNLLAVSESLRLALAGDQVGQLQCYSGIHRDWHLVAEENSSLQERRADLIINQDYLLLCLDLLGLFRTSLRLRSISAPQTGQKGQTRFQRIGSGAFSEEAFATLLPNSLLPAAVITLGVGEPIGLEHFPLQAGRGFRMQIYSASVLPAVLQQELCTLRPRLGIGFPLLAKNGKTIAELIVGGPMPYVFVLEPFESLWGFKQSRLANSVASGVVRALTSPTTTEEVLAQESERSLTALLARSELGAKILSQSLQGALEFGLWPS